MRRWLAVVLGSAVSVAGLMGWSAPAMADSVTTLSSFSDPRNAMPQRPGHTIKRVRYGLSASGWYVIPASSTTRWTNVMPLSFTRSVNWKS